MKAQLPKSFWGKNVATTTYPINKYPFKVIDFKTHLYGFRVGNK